MQDPYKEQFDHLVKMAQIPGAKHHAWYRAKELATDPSGLWVGLDTALAAEMERLALLQERRKPGG